MGSKGGTLDELPMSPFQFWSVVMVSATVILDGLDNQMLGLAAPSLLKDWGAARDSLGIVFAFGFVGMFVGTLVSGSIGDRFGRRLALLWGVAIFGLATLLTGFSETLWQVGMLKFLAGVGLGGVPGTAAAMISEFTPRRWRSVAVTFGVVCVSIGGILGGVAAAEILPPLGWRWLFYLGGVVTMLFVIFLWFLLPESPRYLAQRPDRRAELDRILQRIGHGSALEPSPAANDQSEASHTPISALFAPGLLRDTAALSIAMLSGMFMIYLMFNWAPTMLFTLGFDLKTASLGLTSFNMGGTVGAMSASVAIMRFGSRPTLILMALVGSAVCLFIASQPANGSQTTMLTALGALGLFASAAQSAMFAVGTHAFPTAVRARGLGLMGAAGRAGAIISAVCGSWLIGGGAPMFFGTLAALMVINALGFIAVRGHIPRLAKAQG